MPGLSFPSQNNRYMSYGAAGGGGSRRPGAWLVPVVLVILCIAIITLCVRFEGGGPFATVRGAVQTVTKPVGQVVYNLTTPLRSASSAPSGEVEQLQYENELLKTAIAELEEYRQQNQRLTALVQLADTYALSTLSAKVTNVTGGWSRIATIDKGSDDGLRIGMGVISSSGLYGQIETVTAHASTVRLITDANSSVSAMVQNSRARGILTGSYDGTLSLQYVSTEYTIGEGDYVITSGDGGTYPNGLIIGTVKVAEPDPSKLYYRIQVDPIFNLASCQEVMVLTGDETQVASILDEGMLDNIKDALTAPSSSAATQAMNAMREGTSQTFSSADGADASGADGASGSSGSGNSGSSDGDEPAVTSGGGSASGDGGASGADDADSGASGADSDDDASGGSDDGSDDDGASSAPDEGGSEGDDQ